MNENNFEIPVITSPTGNSNGGVGITENKKSGLLKGVVAFVVLVCLIGGVAYGYNTGIFGGVKYTEENLVSGLLNNFSKIETATSEFSFELKREPRAEGVKYLWDDTAIEDDIDDINDTNNFMKTAGKNAAVSFSMKTLFDVNTEKGAADSSFSITAGISDFPPPLSNLTAKADILKKGDVVYFKFNELPDLLMSLIPIPLNQWYEATNLIEPNPPLEFKLLTNDPEILAKVESTATTPEDIAPMLDKMYIPTGITSAQFKKASLEFNNGETVVSVAFNDEGSALLAKLTKENIGRMMVIFLNGNIISNPIIRNEILNGTAQISGHFSLDEALQIVQELNSATPIETELNKIIANTKKFISDYFENKETLVARTLEISKFADESKIFSFTDQPIKEELNGAKVYRYNLKIRKEGANDFLDKLTDETKKNPKFLNGYYKDTKSASDIKGMNNFLDGLENNGKLILITDMKGQPLTYELSIGYLLPNTVSSMSGEQITLILKINISDVNMPVSIETPTNVKSMQELFDNSQ